MMMLMNKNIVEVPAVMKPQCYNYCTLHSEI